VKFKSAAVTFLSSVKLCTRRNRIRNCNAKKIIYIFYKRGNEGIYSPVNRVYARNGRHENFGTILTLYTKKKKKKKKKKRY
jgi:hypothetical protein